MKEKEVMTFIITDIEDNKFVKSIYRVNSIMVYGNGFVLHEPKSLFSFLDNVKDDFPFRILVHAGLTDKDDVVGMAFLQELKNNFKEPKFTLISRKFSYFPNQESVVDYQGEKLYNTIKIDNEFIDNLFVFKKSDLKDIKLKDKIKNEKIAKTSNIEKNEIKTRFAIQTGLVKDEFTEYTNLMDGEIKNGIFIGKIKNQTDKDYKDYLTIVSQKKMGMVDAAITSKMIFEKINPELLILTGVCGGRKSEVKKYDIIIPENVIDIVSGKYENGNFVPYNNNEDINDDLIDFIKKITSKPKFVKTEMYNLIPVDDHYDRHREIVSSISIHYDSLACGPFVLKTDEHLEKTAKKINDKIVGFEMEGYGLMRASKLSKNKLSIIVKSVMDYTDSKKGDNQETISVKDKDKIPKGEKIKKMASYMSFICTRALLPYIDKYLKDNTV